MIGNLFNIDLAKIVLSQICWIKWKLNSSQALTVVGMSLELRFSPKSLKIIIITLFDVDMAQLILGDLVA